VHRVLVRKAEVNAQRVGCVYRRRDSVTGRESVDWLYLAPNKDHSLAVVNTGMNRPGP
jgi:hypothetical protein